VFSDIAFSLAFESPARVDFEHRAIAGPVAEDPKAEDALARKGQLALDFGQLWMKGQHIATGQANVKAYNRKLRDLIAAGKAKPSEIISHQLPLEKAPEGYAHFDARDEGWTKVVLKTAA
jgi:threonine dehydrogenase-like Zn-dependent dehydrogenase